MWKTLDAPLVLTAKLDLAGSKVLSLISWNLYETEFNLHVNEISFSYARVGNKTRL